MPYPFEGQLTTDNNNMKLCHMYILLFPAWAGIKELNNQMCK